MHQYERFKDYCSRHCVNRKLVLHDIGLGQEGSKVISQIIHRNKEISRIEITKNQLGDAGAKAIADILPANKNIVKLDLSSNDFGKRGGLALLEALTYNESIVEVNLSSLEGLYRNKIGPIAVR